MSNPPYRALRIILSIVSVFTAVAGLLIVFSGRSLVVASCIRTSHGIIPESFSRGIQDDPSLGFKEFCNRTYLVSLDAHFLECSAKVLEKPIIMPVI